MDHNLRAFWNPFLVTNSLQLQRWSMIFFGEKTTGCAIFTGEKHHQTPKHHKTVCQFQGSSGSYRNYFLGESWPQFGALGWCVGGPWPLRSPKQNNDIEIPPKIHMKNHEDAITLPTARSVAASGGRKPCTWRCLSALCNTLRWFRTWRWDVGRPEAAGWRPGTGDRRSWGKKGF